MNQSGNKDRNQWRNRAAHRPPGAQSSNFGPESPSAGILNVGLPHSIEAESAVLCCALIDGLETMSRCEVAGLRPESFYDPKHALVFAALRLLESRRLPFEVYALAEVMKADGTLLQVGGYAYLTELSGAVPTSASAQQMVDQVREMEKRRMVARLAQQLAAEACDLTNDANAFVADAENRLASAALGVSNRLPEVMNWGELIGAQPRPLPPQLVDGFLFLGAKMMLAGGSKSFKTWVLMDMALSVATGTPWWGMRTAPVPVLFVNFELQPWSFERRVRSIIKAKGITSAADFHVWNLRGRGRDFRELRLPLLNKVRRLKIGLVILDPIYKCLGDRDENSNGEVGDLLNEIESVAVDGECALVHGHHFVKGDSSEKDKRDLGAGAGAWMRDPDASVVLRPREEEDTFTAEFILRDLEPKSPMVVRWKPPVMEWMPGADPSALRKPGRPKETGTDNVMGVLGEDKLTHSEWMRRCERQGMAESTFKRRKAEALELGLVEQIGVVFSRKHA
jgi:RecA-family ATPase